MPYIANEYGTQRDRDLAARNRKRGCWSPDCPYRAFFEDWDGWRWCWRHYWRNIKGKENNKWFYIKTTKV